MARGAAVSSVAAGWRGEAGGVEVAMGTDLRPLAVILAGGLGRRLGYVDKALLRLRGRPLLDHVLDRVRPQVRAVAISANGSPSRFAEYGVPVLADPLPDTPGPLAGILAGMRWVQRVYPGADLLLSVPTDTPLLPADLVTRLAGARGPAAPIACAQSDGRRHPVVALWPVSLADDLAAALAQGVRGVEAFAARHGMAEVAFPTQPVDPFLNINDRAGLTAASRVVA